MRKGFLTLALTAAGICLYAGYWIVAIITPRPPKLL